MSQLRPGLKENIDAILNMFFSSLFFYIWGPQVSFWQIEYYLRPNIYHILKIIGGLQSKLILVTTATTSGSLPPTVAVVYCYKAGTETAKFRPIFFLQNALLGVLFKGLNNAVAWQKWQISGMPSIDFSLEWYSIWKVSTYNNSERPVDALALILEKYQWLTHWLSDNLKSRDASASKKYNQSSR